MPRVYIGAPTPHTHFYLGTTHTLLPANSRVELEIAYTLKGVFESGC